jgi:hypothetical protein
MHESINVMSRHRASDARHLVAALFPETGVVKLVCIENPPEGLVVKPLANGLTSHIMERAP